ncbi:MAG TPA: hypothetical protein VF912_20025 [Anaeromyxobacter sp.]
MHPLAFALVASLKLAAAPAAPAPPLPAMPSLVVPEPAKEKAAAPRLVGSKPASPRRAEAKPSSPAPKHTEPALATPAAPQGAAPAAPATVASAELGAAYADHEAGLQLVEQKCAKCHTLSLALGSELSAPEWKLHMKRMATRPGAGITEEQGKRIHEYLKASAASRP